MRSSAAKTFLKGIPFAVIGGHAVAHYLSTPPAGGLDVLIAWPRLADAEAGLAAAGARRLGAWAPGGSVWRTADGGALTLMALEEEWVAGALRPRERTGDGLPVLGRAWLVLMKLRSARAHDLEDVNRLLAAADEAGLRAVRRVVRTHQPQDAEDLESLIQLSRWGAKRRPAKKARPVRRTTPGARATR